MLLSVLLIDNYGLSHYTSYLARGLSQYVKVILYGFSRETYKITGAEKVGVEFHEFSKELQQPSNSTFSRLVRPLLWLFAVRKILTETKYDIVHVQGHLPFFFVFIPYLKIRHKGIYWTMHDIEIRPSNYGVRARIQLWADRAMSQSGILRRFSDTIIVHGLSLKQQLIEKGVSENKIHIIPHVGYEYLVVENDSVYPGDYILVFGRIAPYKGFEVLIRAARLAKNQLGTDLSILIAGKGDDIILKNILASDDYRNIEVRNEFISYSEIPKVFLRAKFLVLPYTGGSQSGVVPLAYTFSKPVIVSDVGSIAEYVEHGKTGYVFRTGDAEELAGYMVELFTNGAKCLEMGVNAHKKMMEEMSLEKCSQMIYSIYGRDQGHFSVS